VGRRRALAGIVLALVVAAGCGGGGTDRSDGGPVPGPPIVTRPIGVGPGFRLPARSQRARRGLPIAGLACRPGPLAGPVVAHLEIFARRETLIIPQGIGIVAGRCRYPLRTRSPTGLIDAGRAGLTFGDLLAVWGQPLGKRRLAGFHGPIVAFVDGRRVRGNIADIPIGHHSEIVVEVSGYVHPHAHYVFPRSS
jgi:hypothetical protein